MKRFYKEAAAMSVPGGFGVALDARPVKTPLKAPLIVPSKGLARAIAAEWAAQGEVIGREAMRLTRLACTALDRVPNHRDAMLDEVIGYGATDLICYRAERPASLIERQSIAWDPLLQWLNATHGAMLAVTRGISPVEQPPEAVTALRGAAEQLDAFRLTALHLAAGASGSLVIGLAVLAGRLDGEAAFQASQIDEAFQIEQWGVDAEFEARRAVLRADLEAAAEAVRLLNE
ncbi:MAG: ATPase [Alphaproteobacteria bacterium]|nr:ATPase [Alphaproteobacteria bacterium]